MSRRSPPLRPSAELFYRRAILLFRSRRFELAEGELAAALATEPSHARSLALLAQCRLAQGKPAEASKLALDAIAAQPDDDQAYLVAGFALLEQGALDRAERMARDCIERSIEQGHGYVLLADIHGRRQEWAPMVRAANAALQADPSDVQARNLRAIGLRGLGRDATALAELHLSLQLQPESAMSHCNVAWSLLLSGRRDAAELHFREALRVDPECESAQAGLIEILKARAFLYRAMLRLGLSLARSAPLRFALIIAGCLAYSMARNWWYHPTMANFARPAVTAYVVVAVGVLMFEPIGNGFLLLHPRGRLALSPKPRREAALIAVCCLGAVGAAAVGAVGWERGYQAAIWPIAIAFPVFLANRSRDRLAGAVLGWFALVVFVEGIPFLVSLALGPAAIEALPAPLRWSLHAGTWVYYSFIIALLLFGVLNDRVRRA